jgi:hypothetical protein
LKFGFGQLVRRRLCGERLQLTAFGDLGLYISNFNNKFYDRSAFLSDQTVTNGSIINLLIKSESAVAPQRSSDDCERHLENVVRLRSVFRIQLLFLHVKLLFPVVECRRFEGFFEHLPNIENVLLGLFDCLFTRFDRLSVGFGGGFPILWKVRPILRVRWNNHQFLRVSHFAEKPSFFLTLFYWQLFTAFLQNSFSYLATMTVLFASNFQTALADVHCYSILLDVFALCLLLCIWVSEGRNFLVFLINRAIE